MGPEQLGQLINAHAAALVLYARQWCAIPEDIVQEAFLKLVTQTTPPTSPIPWLYCVVRNRAISASRTARRRQRYEALAAAEAQPWLLPGEDSGLDAETASAALQRLPIEQREVIVAHLWGGLTFEEIGQLMGSSASTAHRWYMAGLTGLRERLGVACPSNPLMGS
ncbi:MAG: RNA polymerase sigma factor [Gemmataceae bacterium]